MNARLCPDGKKHFWRWDQRSFDLSLKAGDAQVCNRCGQARLLNELGNVKDYAPDLDTLVNRYA